MQHYHFSRVDQVGIDQIGIDQIGIDHMGVDQVGIYLCRNLLTGSTMTRHCILPDVPKRMIQL